MKKIIIKLTSFSFLLLILVSCNKEDYIISNELNLKVLGIESYLNNPLRDNAISAGSDKSIINREQIVSFENSALKAQLSVENDKHIEQVASVHKNNFSAITNFENFNDFEYFFRFYLNDRTYSTWIIPTSNPRPLPWYPVTAGVTYSWFAVGTYPDHSSHYQSTIIEAPDIKSEILFDTGTVTILPNNTPSVEIRFKRLSARVAIRIDASDLDAEIQELEVKPVNEVFRRTGLRLSTSPIHYYVHPSDIVPLFTADFKHPANTIAGQVKEGYYYTGITDDIKNFKLNIVKCVLKRRDGTILTLNGKEIQFLNTIKPAIGKSTLLTIKLRE